MDQIHPYELLGVTHKDSREKVRNNFKRLAMYCHPDKGGSKEDMDVLYCAYKYVIEQIEYGEHGRTIEGEEKKFKEFMENQRGEIPSIFDIMTDGANKKFNDMWERKQEKEEMCYKGKYENIELGELSRALVEYKEPKTEMEINFQKERVLSLEDIKDFSGKDAGDYNLAFLELDKNDLFEEKDVIEEFERIKEERKKMI